MIGPSIVATIATSVVVWVLIFLSRRFAPLIVRPLRKLQNDEEKLAVAVVRIPSMIFSCVVVFWAGHLLTEDRAILADRVYGSSFESQMLMSIAAGYFLWDVQHVLLHWEGFAFFAHAVVCLYVYAGSLLPFVQFYGCIFLLFEASTIMLNVSWFVRLYEYSGDSLVYKFVGALFALVFFVVRILLGNYVSLFLFYSDMWSVFFEASPLIRAHIIMCCVINAFLMLLNVYWFYKILVMVFGAKKSKEKKTQ